MLALTHPAPGLSLLLEHPDPLPGPGWPADIPGLEYAGEVMALVGVAADCRPRGAVGGI